MAAFTPSSRTNPCPMCDRTRDGDCRILDSGIVLCHTILNGVARGEQHSERPFVYCGQSDDAQGFGTWKPLHLCEDRKEKAPRKPDTVYFNYRFWDGTPTPVQRYRKDAPGKPKEVKWCKGGLGGRPQVEVAPYLWAEATEQLCPGDILFIVKGELKAQQLASRHLQAISILDHSERLVTELRALVAKQIAIVLVPDNDLKDLDHWYANLTAAIPQAKSLLCPLKGMDWRNPPDDNGLGIEDWIARSQPTNDDILAAITAEQWQPSQPTPEHGLSAASGEKELTMAERITEGVEALLRATLADDQSEIDASLSELYRLGVSRERSQERVLMLWAERNGYNLSTGGGSPTTGGRTFGKAKEGAGLRQQLPGFLLDRDLHLLVATAFGGKTTACAELATVMSARDRGFLDHEAPRTDDTTDTRNTVLVIASDGEASAYSMWESYLQDLSADERGANIEIWAQDDDTGEQAWNVSLRNLDRLVRRLEQGDLCMVVMDTANAILRGAGVHAGIGPIETYLRLLKQIVCRHCALLITHHTNRSGTPDLKGIGGHPAFQEVPSVIHMIEAKPQADGSLLRLWHVLKLRGSNYRKFAYELRNGSLVVTEGHLFENCDQQVLVALHKQLLIKAATAPGELIRVTKRPPQSVYNALERLRGAKLVRRYGNGYRLTPSGQAAVDAMRV